MEHKFIVLDIAGGVIYDDLGEAIDKVSDLNYNQATAGQWEVYKVSRLTREDFEKYLPNVSHPSIQALLGATFDDWMEANAYEQGVPPFIAFLNDASKVIRWQNGEESKEITVSFFPDGTFQVIDGQDNLPTWYQFE